MFADFSQETSKILLNVSGLEAHPEFEATFKEVMQEEFPIVGDELAGITEETADVIPSVVVEMAIITGDHHGIDLSSDDAELSLAVMRVAKLPKGRLFLDVAFFDPNGDDSGEDTNTDDGEWD